MGRPINKHLLGDVAGSLQVTHNRRTGNAETAGNDDTHIIRQRSTNKFLVADTSEGWTEILKLVAKDAGTLEEGEFRIEAVDPDEASQNVVRLYNSTIRITGTQGPQKVVWGNDVPGDRVDVQDT
jgi:hypothetical protein